MHCSRKTHRAQHTQCEELDTRCHYATAIAYVLRDGELVQRDDHRRDGVHDRRLVRRVVDVDLLVAQVIEAGAEHQRHDPSQAELEEERDILRKAARHFARVPRW